MPTSRKPRKPFRGSKIDRDVNSVVQGMSAQKEPVAPSIPVKQKLKDVGARALRPKPHVTYRVGPNSLPIVQQPVNPLKATSVSVDQGKISRHLPKPAMAAAGVVAGGALAGGAYWGLKRLNEIQQDYPS